MEDAEPLKGVGWEEPPAKVKYDWDAIAAKLRRRPGKWLKVFDEDRTTVAVAIRNGSIKALTSDKGFEITTSNNKIDTSPRTCTLYVRYVKENDTTKKEK